VGEEALADEAVLGQLLDAWRERRAAPIAEAIDAVTTRMALPAIAANRAAHHALWLAIAAERRAADWPRLLGGILGTANRFGTEIVAQLKARITAVASWPADPRTPALAAELLRTAGYEGSSGSTQPFWQLLFALVVEHGDHRAIATIDKLDPAHIFRHYSDRAKMKVWFDAEVAALRAALRARYPAEPALDANTTALVRQVAKQRKRSGDGKLAEALRARDARLAAGSGPAKPARAAKVARIAPRAAGNLLDEAAAAIDQGAFDVALPALLEAWRAERVAPIAGLIEEVGKRLDAPKLVGTKRDALQAAWLAIAKQRRPQDLPMLVEEVTTTMFRSTHALERVKAIADWPADPRTFACVALHVRQPIFYTGSTKPFWTALFDLVVDHGDPRSVAGLGELAASLERVFVKKWTDLKAIAGWFRRELERARARLAARYPDGLPAPTEATAAICARMAKQLAAAGERDAKLFAAIVEDPSDDHARTVYGDHLASRGDPRGELIALQLAGVDPVRAQALVKEHAKAWLGRLAPLVELEDVRFERGFLARVALVHNASPELIAQTTGDPIWATVRGLRLGYGDLLPDELLRHPMMKSLEHLGGINEPRLTALLAWDRVPYRSLEIDFDDGHGYEQLIAAKPKLAALRRLTLDAYRARPERFTALWKSWLGKQLEHFALWVGYTDLVRWWNAIGRNVPELGAFELIQANASRSSIAFRRVRGALSVAEIALRDQGKGGADAAVALDALPAKALTALRVTGRPLLKAERTALEATAKRFGVPLEVSEAQAENPW
jgi:uncharacterized protein (TIGR02996 family)